MSVEHISPVNKRAALVVPMQHIHELVPLSSLKVGSKGRSSGNLELDQVQGSTGVNHRVMLALLDGTLQVPLSQHTQGGLAWGPLQTYILKDGHPKTLNTDKTLNP